MRLSRRLAVSSAVGALILSGLVTLNAGQASAEPVANARSRAAALRVQVDRLTVAAQLATEDYDEAQAQLGQVITRHLLAQRQLESAARGVDVERSNAGSRVRALYRNGGSLGLLSSVIGAQSLGDALNRYRAVQRMVSNGTAVVREGQAFHAGAAAVEAELARLATEQTQLEQQVTARANTIRSLLARQQALLAAANAEVLRLVEEQRAAAEAAAAARAAAQLAAAGALGNATPDERAAAAVAAARTQLGKPYEWGATGTESFDCSGLTGWAYARAGIALPRTSRQQWFFGRHVTLGELAPGDLLFWANDLSNPRTIHHVAIYSGGGLMLAAPHTGAVVREQPVYLDGYIGAVRPAG